MRSKQLQDFLAGLLECQQSEMDQRCRTFREVGLVESGGRGNSAPHLSMQEGALHVLSTASRRAADAFEVGHRLMFDCELLRHFHYRDRFTAPEGFTIGDLIIGIMRGEHDDVIAVELSDNGHFAWATLRDFQHKICFQSMNAVAETPEADWLLVSRQDSLVYGRRMVIAADRLRQIGEKIEPDEPSHLKGMRKGRVLPVPFGKEAV